MAAPEKVAAFLAERRNVVIAGVRQSGEPHLSPNWFYFDGEKFYVSTTRGRVKYRVFRSNPHAVLLIDDSTGFRYVRLPVTVDIREDLPAELPRFRDIREKMGVAVPSDAEFLAALRSEGRVLLAMTPDVPQEAWVIHGLD